MSSLPTPPLLSVFPFPSSKRAPTFPIGDSLGRFFFPSIFESRKLATGFFLGASSKDVFLVRVSALKVVESFGRPNALGRDPPLEFPLFLFPRDFDLMFVGRGLSPLATVESTLLVSGGVSWPEVRLFRLFLTSFLGIVFRIRRRLFVLRALRQT